MSAASLSIRASWPELIAFAVILLPAVIRRAGGGSLIGEFDITLFAGESPGLRTARAGQCLYPTVADPAVFDSAGKAVTDFAVLKPADAGQ